tara:strand:- start:1461 stop:1682 length:222 start_codon:yes stop_codon:yes gene_type:complete
MKLTREKLKQMIVEEMSLIEEDEDTNAMIDQAQAAIQKEAEVTFGKIKQAAEKAGLETEMLKGIFIQFLQNME